jgi:hypothetical protein
MNITAKIASSKKLNLLFQMINEIEDKECGIKLYSTTEGVYLTRDKRATTFSKNENDPNSKNHLLLADFDYKTY